MTGSTPTDNRHGTLASGRELVNKNGDCFTIANVNARSMIDKSDSGQPMTFRVISGGAPATLTTDRQIVIIPALTRT